MQARDSVGLGYKPHVLNISFTRRFDVWLNEEPWGFRIAFHDNFFDKANIFRNFVVVEA